MRLKTKSKLLIVLLLFYLITFIFFLYHAYLRLNYPYDITTADGFTLGFAKWLWEGRQIYNDIQHEPKYYVNSYPPIYYFFVAILFPFFGKILLTGKIISFTSALLTGFFVYKILHKETKNKLISLIFSLSVFSSYYVFFWALNVRVDFLALFFSILGIYFAELYSLEKKHKKRNFYLSILFFVLSFYTKQTYLAAPLATFLFLFKKNKKVSFQFLFIYLFFLLSIFFFLNALTNWQFFKHIFLYNLSTKEQFINYLPDLIIMSPFFLCLSILYFFKQKFSLFSLYFISSLFIFLLTLKRPGISSNFFLELFVTMCITSAFYINSIKDEDILKFITTALIIQVYFTLSGGYIAGSIFDNFKYLNNFMMNIESNNKINEYVKNSNGNILIEASGFAIQNQIEPSFDVWKVYILEENDFLSPEELYNYCVEKNFSYIFSFEDLERIRGIKKCIEERYVLIDTVFVYPFEATRFHDHSGPNYLIPRRVYKLVVK